LTRSAVKRANYSAAGLLPVIEEEEEAEEALASDEDSLHGIESPSQSIEREMEIEYEYS